MQGWKICLCALMAAVCAVGAHSAWAQSYEGHAAYNNKPIALQEASYVQVKDGTIEVRLSSSSNFPIAYVVQNDSDQARVQIGAINRIRTALPKPAPDSFLKALVVEDIQGQLYLTALGRQRLHVTLRTEANVIVVTITTGTNPQAQRAANDERMPPAVTAHDPPREGDIMEVVPLKYADVSEVVGLLTNNDGFKRNDYFAPEEPAFGSPSSTGQPTYANANSQSAGSTSDLPYGEKADDVVGVDRRLNAIVLHGAPDIVADLKQKIAMIDLPVQSVLFETIFVELDESGAKNLGIDVGTSSGTLATVLYTGAIGPVTGGYVTTGGTISVQAAVQAQIRNGHGKIISKPRISAQSGSTAKIVTGDALPILTAIALSGVNAVSQQVQYVNVGVTLQIAPRISSDGYITSHIFCAVSSVTGSVQGYPTISQREASTSATVQDGKAFVIGGLMQESEITNNTRVPGLSKVPLLGWLGKNLTGSSSTTDLYIIVVPHIIRGAYEIPTNIADALTAPAADTR
jgi:general secretion pathway protein D